MKVSFTTEEKFLLIQLRKTLKFFHNFIRMKKLLLIIGLLILSCNGKDLTYSQYISSALENVDKGKYQSAFNDFVNHKLHHS